MIKNIKKTRKENEMVVEVECYIRKFASHEILLLTTDKIIDILLKDNIVVTKTIKEPRVKVGNSNVKKVTNKGTWIFEIEENKSEKKATTKKTPTKKTPTKKAPTRVKKSTTNTKKSETSSIRQRMSRIATKKD